MTQQPWDRPLDQIMQNLMRDAAYVQSDLTSYMTSIDAFLDPGTVAGGGPSSGPSDPTVAIVMQRQRYKDNFDNVKYAIIDAYNAIGLARNRMGEVQRLANADQLAAAALAARCSGMGKPGYEEWGDPSCEANAVKAGLCNRCYMASYRWDVSRRGEVA